VQPWEKLDERLVYDGHRKIVRRRFRLPDGSEADYDVKVEPDTIAVVALTPDDDVLLVREFRPGPEETVLEIPGGAVDPGEDTAAAAHRELLEETGYEGELRPVGPILDCAYSTRERYAFVATGCRKVADPRPQTGEHLEVVLLPVADFVDHVRTGRLTDAAVAYRALDALNLLE
jgi:ADP-ribose pyrophosphatase